MNNKDQWFARRFGEYVEDTRDLLHPTIHEILAEMLSEGNIMFMDFSGIDTMVNVTRPLTFALASLETYYENSSWDESMMEEIVNFISVIEEHCEEEDLRSHLSPLMLNLIYQTVNRYMARLNEFDVDQQEQITKAINSLSKYVENLRSRG